MRCRRWRDHHSKAQFAKPTQRLSGAHCASIKHRAAPWHHSKQCKRRIGLSKSATSSTHSESATRGAAIWHMHASGNHVLTWTHGSDGMARRTICMMPSISPNRPGRLVLDANARWRISCPDNSIVGQLRGFWSRSLVGLLSSEAHHCPHSRSTSFAHKESPTARDRQLPRASKPACPVRTSLFHPHHPPVVPGLQRPPVLAHSRTPQ